MVVHLDNTQNHTIENQTKSNQTILKQNKTNITKLSITRSFFMQEAENSAWYWIENHTKSNYI